MTGSCTQAGLMCCVSASRSPSVLRLIKQPTTGLAIWQRPSRPALREAVAGLLALPPFSQVSEGHPALVLRAWSTVLPASSRKLLSDVLLLGRMFSDITETDTVRLRLERLVNNSCRQFHVDGVGLRLLCTYAGPGTEWLDTTGELHRMETGEVAIFKGAAYADEAERVSHRSPPVEHLAPEHRPRLLLCIDEPGRLPIFPVPDRRGRQHGAESARREP